MVPRHHLIGLSLALVVVFAGCSKEEKAAPDLSKQTQIYVTNRDTTVKSGPGPQFKNVSRIPKDTKIDVVGREGDWLLVVSKHGNPPGYIEARDADPSAAGSKQPAQKVQGRYVVVADTLVRKGPGPEHVEVAKVSKGTKINVVGEERGWLKVESKRGNPPGYIDPTYVRPGEK
jgi:uncharacterized protein YgiM (DUF1202 family)